MSTAFDTEMAAVATALLDEFGTNAVLTSVVEGAYDPFAGASGPSASTTATVKASPPEQMETSRSTGRGVGAVDSEVLQTDLFVYVDTIDTAGVALPVPNARRDTLAVAGRTFTIWNVWELRSGDDVAVYGLQLRAS